jgi:hypothetical protein
MPLFGSKEDRAATKERKAAEREVWAKQRAELGLGLLEGVPAGLTANQPTLTLVKHYQNTLQFRSDAQKKANYGWTIAAQSSVRRKQSMVTYTRPNPYYADSQPAPDASAASSISIASELEHLAALRQQGVLSDEEFNAQKAKLLA